MTDDVAQRDQVEASARDAHALLQRTADGTGRLFAERPNDDPTDPHMTRFIESIKERLMSADKWPACPHLGSPQPMFVDAWDDPLFVRCGVCEALKPPLVGDADVTCDMCGRIDRSGLWPVQLALGPIIVALGRCDACTPEHVKQEIRERPR